MTLRDHIATLAALTAEQVANSQFLAELAQQLYQSGFCPSLTNAQQWVAVRAQIVRGEPVSDEMREVEKALAHFIAAEQVMFVARDEFEATLKKTSELQADQTRLTHALEVQRYGLSLYVDHDAAVLRNFLRIFSGYGYEGEIEMVNFMRQVVAERELVKFRRDVLIPDLERQISDIAAQLAELVKPKANPPAPDTAAMPPQPVVVDSSEVAPLPPSIA